MLGLGLWEIVIVCITALIVLGPEKLPQVARQTARLLGQVRRMSDEVRRNFDDVMAEPLDNSPYDAPRQAPQGACSAPKAPSGPVSLGRPAPVAHAPQATEAPAASRPLGASTAAPIQAPKSGTRQIERKDASS